MEIDLSKYQPSEKKKVISAIENNNSKVIASQIVSQTQLPVNTVEILLSQIASETNGHIAVTSDGNLVYSFKPDLKKEYIINSSQSFIKFWFIKLCELIYFCLRLSTGIAILIFRISFAIILISSVILIIILIIWIILAMLFGHNNSNSSVDTGGSFSGGDGLSNIATSASTSTNLDSNDLDNFFNFINSNYIGVGSTNNNYKYSFWIRFSQKSIGYGTLLKMTIILIRKIILMSLYMIQVRVIEVKEIFCSIALHFYLEKVIQI